MHGVRIRRLTSNGCVGDYLAYLASTPRNYVECQIEPPFFDPYSKVHAVDLWSAQELGVDKGYPVLHQVVWWTIICLDGAPERIKHLIYGCGLNLSSARAACDPAESFFRQIILEQADQIQPDPAYTRLNGGWPDGEIFGCLSHTSASELAYRTAHKCAQVNQEGQLPWNCEFHVRAGVGQTMRHAFRGLLTAKRDQLVYCQPFGCEAPGGKMVSVLALPTKP